MNHDVQFYDKLILRSDFMYTILVTGFAPFDHETVNPSYEAIKLLPNHMDGISIIQIELPTVFTTSAMILIDKINETNPDTILMFGQAGGRKSISIERIAINIDDASIPDNQGYQPIDKPIVIDGPPAYFSTLPIKTLNSKLNAKGIPTSISNSAGTFICNHLMYQILHYLKKEKKNAIAGFIHVPYIHEQVHDKPGVFSMNLDLITEAIKIIIHTLKEE